MKWYYYYDYVDKNGKHEVHDEDCSYLPAPKNRTLIGLESNCTDAINRAKKEHPGKKFDGCFFCSRPCHKG